MKFLTQIILFLFIWAGGILLILLLGHIMSLAFANTWQLSTSAKNFCAVLGAIIGLFMAIGYFCQDIDSKQ